MPKALTAVFFIVLQLTQSIGCYAECRCEKKTSIDLWGNVKKAVSESSGSDLLMFGVKTAVVAGVSVVATLLLVSAAGFGAGGIAAGSVAASVQATWFGGAITGVTGGLFSALQSIGAAGLGTAGYSSIVGASTAAVKAYDAVTGQSNDENCDCCA